jgi:hypothetical protein
MNGRLDGWMEGRTDRRMDEWMDGWMQIKGTREENKEERYKYRN